MLNCLYKKKLTLMALAVCACFVFLLCPIPGLASDKMIGADACIGCHDDMSKSFSDTLHGKVFSKDSAYYKYRCEYCHGPGEDHEDELTTESIITFGKDALSGVDDRNTMCLKCHQSDRQVAMWKGSRHARQDMACDSCHVAHEKNTLTDKSPEACLTCHTDIKIDMNKQSHHPIKEGKISCGSCHNPHGTMSDDMLTADHVNDLCYKCHADKRGPFMFEHSPVEENCGTCHTPHGSRHKKLLVQRSPSLCQNCHMGGHTSSRAWDQNAGFNGERPSNRYFGRSCIVCHPNVHGSQAPNSRGKRFLY